MNLEPHLQALRRYSHKLCRGSYEAANDLVQDTLLLALEKEHLYKEQNLLGWLCTIMHNLHASQTQRHKRREILHLNGEITDNLASSDDVEKTVLVRELVQAMEKLPKVYVEAIVDSILGDKYEEIAENRHTQIGTIRSRISRGKERIRCWAGGVA